MFLSLAAVVKTEFIGSIYFSSPYYLHHVGTNPVKYNRTGIFLPDAFNHFVMFVYDSSVFNYFSSDSILSMPENESGNDCGAASGRVGILYYNIFQEKIRLSCYDISSMLY